MPCRKVSEYEGRAGKQRLIGGSPSGPVYVPFATEAECNQACKEGACCEGTTCTVKPACQCQGTGKVFKGVGTTCAPNPCLCCTPQGYPKTGTDCAWCWCFCGDGAAAYPRFVNASLQGTYQMVQPIFEPGPFGGNVFAGFRTKTKSFSSTVTLSAASTLSRSSCPNWSYGSAADGSQLPFGLNGARGQVSLILLNPLPTSVSVYCEFFIIDMSEHLGFTNPDTWATFYDSRSGMPSGFGGATPGAQAIAGPYSSGTCLSGMSGMTHVITQSQFSVSVVVNAVQP